MDKNSVIAKVFYDPGGYGSIAETLKDAKKYDKTITYEDVKKWKASQPLGQTKQLPGKNSFIASAPREEYQMALMFFSDLPDKIKNGLIFVDIFSKFTQIVPVKSKQVDDVLEGIKKKALPKWEAKVKLYTRTTKEHLFQMKFKHILKKKGLGI